jgi:AraC-like DNA-binding protein
MFNDSFKERYKTIPFAYYSARYEKSDKCLVGNEISHNHKETELIIVTDGKVRVCINSRKTYVAKKGDVIVIAPYEYHSYSTFEGEAFDHLCVCFDLELLCDKALVEDLQSGNLCVSSIISGDLPYAKTLYKNIQESVEYCREGAEGWELFTVASLSSFFGIIKRHGHIIRAERSYKDEFCKNVLDIFKKDFGNDLTSGALAKRLNVSPSYFCRKFKTLFGYTFSEYLCIYRIEKSKELLEKSADCVSDVATAVGFSSFSYYSKTFKFYTKTTPSEYRKLHRI